MTTRAKYNARVIDVFRHVVHASNGGAPSDPARVRNLEAHPVKR